MAESVELYYVRGRLCEQLDNVHAYLLDEYKVTLIARHTSDPDAHILITPDDLDEVLEAIQRLKGEGS